MNTRIHLQDQVRQRPEQQFERHEEHGSIIFLQTTTSSSSSSSWWQPSHSWRQHVIWTLLHGLSNRFVFSSRCENIRLQGNSRARASDGVCTQHFVASIFLMRTVCQVVLLGSHPSLTFHAFVWFKTKQCAFPRTVHISRNMSHIKLELTSTFSLATALLLILRHDPRQLLRMSILARSISATIHNK